MEEAASYVATVLLERVLGDAFIKGIKVLLPCLRLETSKRDHPSPQGDSPVEDKSSNGDMAQS